VDELYLKETRNPSSEQQPQLLSDENVGMPPAELRAACKAAYDQLKNRYSLERVAQEEIEVQWEDLLGMASPLSKQIPIQPLRDGLLTSRYVADTGTRSRVSFAWF
jgi:hypothetical protein